MGESGDGAVERLIRGHLARVGHGHHDLPGFDVLASGLSGASTYRLRFTSGDLILKVSTPSSPARVRHGARREIRFYRDLTARVGIAVPALVGSHVDGDGTALLIAAHSPVAEPESWDDTRFIHVARLLGRLHAGFWGREHELAAMGWLRRDDGPSPRDVRRALADWFRLVDGGRFDGILTPARLAAISGLLDCLDGARTAPFPNTLCHGDFHAGNLLIDPDDRLVLADWQETGPGRGPADLSFFIQRATFDGGRPPVEEMVDAYRRSLLVHGGVDVAGADVRRVMGLAELSTRLLHWPAFLGEAPIGQMAAVLDRIDALAPLLAGAGEDG